MQRIGIPKSKDVRRPGSAPRPGWSREDLGAGERVLMKCRCDVVYDITPILDQKTAELTAEFVCKEPWCGWRGQLVLHDFLPPVTAPAAAPETGSAGGQGGGGTGGGAGSGRTQGAGGSERLGEGAGSTDFDAQGQPDAEDGNSQGAGEDAEPEEEEPEDQPKPEKTKGARGTKGKAGR